MKTSKIIIITLLATIALLIVVSMIDIRLNGRRNGDLSSNFAVKRHALHTFSVITISNSMNVSLVQNDSSFLEMTYLKDSIAPKVNYLVANDTLRISGFEKQHHRNGSITINATDSLRMIKLNNSDISIRKFKSVKLLLELDKSSVWLDPERGDQPAFQFLDIVAINHSTVNSSQFKVDSMSVVLRNSDAYLFSVKAGKIFATVSDSSRFNARQPGELRIKKDNSSRVYVNE